MTDPTELVSLTIKRPDERLFSRSKASLAAAKEFKIRTPEDAEDAGAVLREIKGLAKDFEEKRTSITKPINQALREVNALFKPAKAWLVEAEGLLKSRLLEYQNEQERIARELQAKADAEARKEREKLERKAKLAGAVGMSDKAKELREEAEIKIAPIFKSAAAKIAGVVRRETWKAEITNELILVRHIANERNDLLYLIKIDQSALNAWARKLKDELDLPGVKAVKESSIAASR